ncbi:type II toxin-antitoxin system VapC family toxin [Phenylobacterium sp.]|uniref:type II toxin-antitoxin system VapC family toxin n=1 Tax=Phenylobacterium sp. TaxID=1871053 RepID=UPI0025F8C7B5|nr:type II toxin-antitoxin system VapC family toxin [Phenylobacterium sp.]MCA6285287.1 type II toxin-antitoxin system VapC family toxin [Phenylobacterium sp.]MCA6288202.1 type II toxin-antitoxin system VapC family toxin [Phenylobacterium sp.]MCA6309567.1 type II toxin-antitoxin system VapC family toxin [Phenylobacterium sp.]MCA6323032.1 type II toxin-antitoxin system VapC family toxin [Phenylobacterium sp.]MCA6337544.1 type II toxin-antitoxin system VapC family toxin [Phenylobacterium sp.]
MNLLLDTHIVLRAARGVDLGAGLRRLLEDPANRLVFSAASIWEIAIKSGLGRPDFDVPSGVFRRGLLEAGYEELPVTGAHAAALQGLPALHRDPFDRILVAQAMVESLTLLTADRTILAYPGPILAAP